MYNIYMKSQAQPSLPASSSALPSSTWSQNFRHLFARFPRHWLKTWIVFYVAILLLGLIAPDGEIITFVKISGIFLCFFYTLWTFPDDRLLQLAFLATSISDIILAIDNTAVLGVITFLATQIIHLIRLNDGKFPWQLVVFAFAAGLSIFADLLLDFAPLMYVVCFYYVIALVTNIVLSWRWYNQDRSLNPPESDRPSPGSHFDLDPIGKPIPARDWPAIFALLGFMLFLCCDACTGVSYLSLNAAFPAWLYAPANFFAWAFYYPSQIFVSNSSKCAKMVSKGR